MKYKIECTYCEEPAIGWNDRITILPEDEEGLKVFHKKCHETFLEYRDRAIKSGKKLVKIDE